MLVGTNQDQGQRYNRRVVFDLVRRFGSLSRTDIARQAGLSYQAISNMADDLIRDGLLSEVRKRSGRRGQPPVELSINPDGAFSLGFSFNRRRLRGAIVDLAGLPRAEHEIELSSPMPSTVLPAIADVANALIQAAHAPSDRIYGLGLSMPGLSREGRFISPALRSSHAWLADWSGVPIIDVLKDRVGIPIMTDNDAAAAAIGELLHGEDRRYSNFIFVYISDGIGAGLMLNGRPYGGASGMAGEFGHLTVEAGGRPCTCGREGCLETYASLNSARQQVLQTSEAVDSADLTNLLERRDARMLHWVDEAGDALRKAIVSVENLLDPEVVIIGGTIPSPVLDALMRVIAPLPPRVADSGANDRPRLIQAKVGLGPATLGAAALPIFAETASDLSMLLKHRAELRSVG